MNARIYYTTEEHLIRGSDRDWSRGDRCYVRGVDIAGEFDENSLDDLKYLVDTAHKETEYAEYRIVKITEMVEVIYVPPPKTTQLAF